MTYWASGRWDDPAEHGAGIAAGIFGLKALSGAGGVAFLPQLLMTGMAILIALGGGFAIYGVLKIPGCASIRNRSSMALT